MEHKWYHYYGTIVIVIDANEKTSLIIKYLDDENVNFGNEIITKRVLNEQLLETELRFIDKEINDEMEACAEYNLSKLKINEL